ncbi:MAG: L-threonylcarbamoyladenylate synthase [Bacteroidales bacterium]
MIVKIYPDSPNEKSLHLAVELFRRGGLVAYPTDTVYAVGCDMTLPKAIDKLARFKNCSVQEANFSVICSSIAQASHLLKPISQEQFRFLKQHVPGPYTFIFPYSSTLPSLLRDKRKTVGIRISAHPVLRALIDSLGNPLVTTSLHAPATDPEYETDPELIHERYGSQIDLVVDGGLGLSTPSTVIDCSGDGPLVIREGLGQIEW